MDYFRQVCFRWEANSCGHLVHTGKFEITSYKKILNYPQIEKMVEEKEQNCYLLACSLILSFCSLVP
jgi:hypothetical protein